MPKKSLEKLGMIKRVFHLRFHLAGLSLDEILIDFYLTKPNIVQQQTGSRNFLGLIFQDRNAPF